jgi:hypothetical protein
VRTLDAFRLRVRHHNRRILLSKDARRQRRTVHHAVLHLLLRKSRPLAGRHLARPGIGKRLLECHAPTVRSNLAHPRGIRLRLSVRNNDHSPHRDPHNGPVSPAVHRLRHGRNSLLVDLGPRRGRPAPPLRRGSRRNDRGHRNNLGRERPAVHNDHRETRNDRRRRLEMVRHLPMDAQPLVRTARRRRVQGSRRLGVRPSDRRMASPRGRRILVSNPVGVLPPAPFHDAPTTVHNRRGVRLPKGRRVRFAPHRKRRQGEPHSRIGLHRTDRVPAIRGGRHRVSRRALHKTLRGPRGLGIRTAHHRFDDRNPKNAHRDLLTRNCESARRVTTTRGTSPSDRGQRIGRARSQRLALDATAQPTKAPRRPRSSNKCVRRQNGWASLPWQSLLRSS